MPAVAKLIPFICRFLLALTAGVLCAALVGCAGYQRDLETSLRQARSGQYAAALTSLEESSLAGSGRNRLLYLLEKGSLLQLSGEYRRSNEVFEEADRLMEELFTRSLSAEGLSFISNDYIIPYVGEDYESAYLSYLKALNYLALNDLEGALVECRRVDEKLNYYNDQYGGKNVYKEDAFLRLLTGLIYEAEGDSNNAFIAYRKSLEAYRSYRDKYGVAVPRLLWGRLLTAAKRTGFLDEYRSWREEARAAGVEPEEGGPVAAVIVNAGRIPVKREEAVVLPTPQGFPVKLALPGFVERSPAAVPLDLRIDGQCSVSAERAQDLAAVARQSLEDKRGRVLAKMIARAVAKELAARKAEKEFGPLAGFTAKVGALLTEQADLRSWSFLPGEIRLAVIPLSPGKHTVTMNGGACRLLEIAEKDLVFVDFRVF